MRNLLCIFLLFVLPLAATAANTKKSLSEALKDNSVKLTAVNVEGMYTGKTTKLFVTNNTKSVMQITVDLGMILKPDEGNYQPMVLAGEETLAVLPHAQGEVLVQTFCGNAPKGCPKRDLAYSFDRIGSDTLVKILRFIKTNALFDYLGQHAVWAITNDHSLSGVYDPARDVVSKKLIELISATTGKPKPDYYTLVPDEQNPGSPAYNPKMLKIIAQFEIRTESPKTLTLGVYDSAGTMIQPVFENQPFPARGHRFEVEFEAENVQAGRYYIRLKEGDAMLQEKMVKVE
ncbi:MAG: hypothetical protein K0Q79_2678 [Flavipsychrobacter sp.]|jgi:hypothetical protein|nr:hypothetical protein [Flavipsychrobacter sp.]